MKYPEPEEGGKLKKEDRSKVKRDKIVEMKEGGGTKKQKFFSTRNAFDVEEGLEPMPSKAKRFETDSMGCSTRNRSIGEGREAG